jgi:hypothetical protein
MATSANQHGVVGADSGAIWMWTEGCVILGVSSPFKMTLCLVDLLRRHLFLSFYNASPLLSTFFLISPAWCYLVAQLVGIGFLLGVAIAIDSVSLAKG